MASVWGKSWGGAWGASWGAVTTQIRRPVVSSGGGGGPDAEVSLSDYIRRFVSPKIPPAAHQKKRKPRNVSALFMLHK